MKAHAKAVATFVLALALLFGSPARASPIVWTDDESLESLEAAESDIARDQGLTEGDTIDLWLPGSPNLSEASFEPAASSNQADLVVVPEPASLLLVGSGAIGVIGRRTTKRRRRRR